jgi:nucleoside-diphosphate-sugar epimerase
VIFNQPLGHLMYCIGLTGNFRNRPFDTVQAHVEVLSSVLQRADFESLTYLSSTRVYMGSDRTDEEAPLQVLPSDLSSLYNLSKLTGEALCHASGRPGVRVARLSNVVGPGMDAASGNFVASLIREAGSGSVVLRSHPDSAKDYLHVNDVVAWLPVLATAGRHQVYNLASGVQLTHQHWAQWVVDRLGGAWTADAAAPMQGFAPIDVRRLQNEFGCFPREADDWTPNSSGDSVAPNH